MPLVRSPVSPLVTVPTLVRVPRFRAVLVRLSLSVLLLRRLLT